MRRRLIVAAVLFSAFSTTFVTACGGSDSNGAQDIELAPESALPEFVRSAPPQVKEAYRFAIANPEVLEAFPCYCGCGNMGHENNLDCYIKQVRADGTIDFENHAFGWTICIDITRDVMRLMKEGKEPKEIRTYIDAEYSQYGPSTDTEPIP